MKGYRFYEELENKNRKDEKSQGNVIALFLQDDNVSPIINWHNKTYECLSATLFYENSPVSVGSVSPEYLSENCRRISEERAREIHPRLFARLDD